MKPFAFASFALLILPAAADARAAQDIVVTIMPETGVAQWVAAVSRQLEGTLRYPYVWREPAPTGGVSVTFRRGETGRPDDVRIVRKSGSARLDRAALSGIQRIQSLHPLPQGMRQDQVFQANIVFAIDDKTTEREKAALNAAMNQTKQESALNQPSPLMITFVYREG